MRIRTKDPECVRRDGKFGSGIWNKHPGFATLGFTVPVRYLILFIEFLLYESKKELLVLLATKTLIIGESLRSVIYLCRGVLFVYIVWLMR